MNRDGVSLKYRKYSAVYQLRQRGLSLVELMIGLLIGLILLGGVLQTLLASKEASVARQNMATVTDDARFLYEFMSRDLRMIGRGFSSASMPLSYSSGVLTSGYMMPDASGTERTVEFTYTLASGTLSYVREVDNDEKINGTLVSGIQSWEVSFGHKTTASGIQYTAFDAAMPDKGEVIAIRSRITFADSGSGDSKINVSDRPLVITVALRNRIAQLFN